MIRYTLVVGAATKKNPPFTVDLIALNNVDALEVIHHFVFDTKEWKLMNQEFGELVAPHTGVKHDGSCQRCGCRGSTTNDVRFINSDYARMDGHYCRSCRQYMRNSYTLLQAARKRYTPSKRKDMTKVAEARDLRMDEVARKSDLVLGRGNRPHPKNPTHSRQLRDIQNKKAIRDLQNSPLPKETSNE